MLGVATFFSKKCSVFAVFFSKKNADYGENQKKNMSTCADDRDSKRRKVIAPASGGSLRHEILSRGWVHLQGVLDPETVQSLVTQLTQDLRGQKGVPDPTVRSAWPRSLRSHRIFESAPAGVGVPEWEGLATTPTLVAALDEIMGEHKWSLPLNANPYVSGSGPRHWYCPVSFPERPDHAPLAHVAAADACATERPCPFLPASEWPAAPSAPPCSLWAPISRRRWVGRGWHIDGAAPMPPVT